MISPASRSLPAGRPLVDLPRHTKGRRQGVNDSILDMSVEHMHACGSRCGKAAHTLLSCDHHACAPQISTAQHNVGGHVTGAAGMHRARTHLGLGLRRAPPPHMRAPAPRVDACGRAACGHGREERSRPPLTKTDPWDRGLHQGSTVALSPVRGPVPSGVAPRSVRRARAVG